MKIIFAAIASLLISVAGAWGNIYNNAIEVRIVTDQGHTLPTYPVKMRKGIHKVYAEAVKGDHYRIEVRNRLDRRIGVVIAVDGRNIINGQKSWLKSNERMYILEPYGHGEFAGWRTAQDKINRFYFTDVPDSYAAAFGDKSAMGVIAVAAYPEIRRYQPPAPLSQSAPYYKGRPSGSMDKSEAAPSAPSVSERSKSKKAAGANELQESAGTGYGREEYAPSYTVAFEAEKRPVETVLLKYEWRSTLCKMGIVSCSRPHRHPHNRMWDNDGFAPPPPGR